MEPAIHGMTIWNAYKDRSTQLTKRTAKRIHLQPTPNGHQVYRFEVGQSVRSLANDVCKQGTTFKVTLRIKDNGFCRYYGAGLWHRQQDIEAI